MLPGTNDNSGQAAAPLGFRHPVSLVTPSVRPSSTHARAFFTTERRRRRRRRRRQVFHLLLHQRGAGRVPDSPRYRRRHRRTSWGKKKKREEERRRRDSHAVRHRRESRAGERITRPGTRTGSSLTTTTTAKIRTSPVASLFPLHRWGGREGGREGKREGGCGCEFSGFR